MTPNCHEEHTSENKTPHQHKGHGMMMILCVIGAILAMLILPKFGRSWGFLVVLLCPLMHIFMMKGMFGKEHK